MSVSLFLVFFIVLFMYPLEKRVPLIFILRVFIVHFATAVHKRYKEKYVV